MPAQPLFHLENANLGYEGQQVLNGITLTIGKGERVALVGKSGTGKSTLLQALWRQQAGQIALCPQSHGLVQALSVYNNIFMGQLHHHNWLYNLWNLVTPIKRHRNAIQALADELEIGHLLDQSVDRLSGGQQQRTALGRALYQQRGVFFGDEPLSALDPLQAARLLKRLRDSHHTLVIALHDRELARSGFDRLIGIRAGQVTLDLPVDQVSDTQLNSLYA